MNVHTYYDDLKVARDAPFEVMAAAYKALAKKYHPDTNPADTEATRIMTALNEARETLLDPQKRRDYDRWVRQQENPALPLDVFRRARKIAMEHGVDEKDLHFRKGAFRVTSGGKSGGFAVVIKIELQCKQRQAV